MKKILDKMKALIYKKNLTKKNKNSLDNYINLFFL